MNKILIIILPLLLFVGCSNSVDSKYVGKHNGRWEGEGVGAY